MKVLALGGSGGMGRYAVETALTFDGIEQIIVADINEDAANSYANSLPDKVVGIGLDVTDKSKLTEIMLNVDVVLNTVGPVSYTHLRAHETRHDLVCRLLLEKKN